MNDLIRDLAAAGFTPLNIVLAMAVVVLWRVTRANLAAAVKHAAECNRDRQRLHRRIEALSRRVEKVARCPEKDCPMR